MSPFLSRIAGLLGRTAGRSASGPDASSPPPTSGGSGGRGRGGGRGEPTSRPPTDNRSGGRGRDDNRGSSGGGNYGNSSYDRRRRLQRRDLDQPLPEDIAFRPPAEGGDRSILPSRRRPPPGLRATKRVLLTGHRFVPRGPGGEDIADDMGEIRDDLPDATPSLPGASNEPPAGEGGERSGRRRRGRRGGRGRRRGGGDAAGDAGGTGDATAPDDA